MESRVNKPPCFIKGELIVNGERKAFGYQANEMETLCKDCLRRYDGTPCVFKPDDEPCEDFLPTYFKDTAKYIYIDNKWFKSTMGEIHAEANMECVEATKMILTEKLKNKE